MYGAIIGDIIGSRWEFRGCKTKDFELLNGDCSFTDDTVMTVAIADALIHSGNANDLSTLSIKKMQEYGQRYPNQGYGMHFRCWLTDDNPKPYNSYGNGSAMRVSPCGIIATSLEEAESLARVTSSVTHNHPEGIKGACSVAAAIYMAKTGSSKEDIRAYIEEHYYPLNQTIDEIRPTYRFDETCQGSVPLAITAFLESMDYEDCIRNAVSLGGDSDTQAAIAGAIAWSYYGRNGLTDVMENLKEQAKKMLPIEFVEVIQEFESRRKR